MSFSKPNASPATLTRNRVRSAPISGLCVTFHSTVNGKYLPFHKKSPLMNKGFPQFHPSKIAQMAW